MSRRSIRTPIISNRSAARVCWGLALAGWFFSGSPGPNLALAQPAGGQPDLEQVLQSAPKGKLSIKAVLVEGGATKPVPGAEAHVHLFHNNEPFKELKVLLDENGAATLDDLPVVMGVVPLVRVEYKGLTYQEAGPALDASNREASVEVKVYDSTQETPAWHIPMRHIMAQRVAGGLAVLENVVVDNPSSKTWLGHEPADDKGNRPTVELTLPQGATQVTLESGFHGWCCTSYEGNELHIKMPLMPGSKSFKFSYTVPDSAGGAALTVAARAPVDHLMVLLPDDGSVISPIKDGPDLRSATSTQGGAAVRMFQCDALRTGQAVGLVVSGPLSAPESQASQAWPAQTWIAGGVGVFVLAGIGVWRLRKAARPAVAG